MQNKKDKYCRCLWEPIRRNWLWIIAAAAVSFFVALATTGDLPWHSVYEARYEFRVRSFRKNVETCDIVMRNMDVMGSHGLYRYMCQRTAERPEGELTCKLKYDNTEKITLRVRGSDSTAVAQYAAELYADACDTLQRFGDTLFVRVAEVLRKSDDEEARRYVRELEIDLASHAKYMDLLNEAELPQAHTTPNRICVLLWSLVAGLLFSLVVCVLRGRRCEDTKC
jgi:hypothetical protein